MSKRSGQKRSRLFQRNQNESLVSEETSNGIRHRVSEPQHGEVSGAPGKPNQRPAEEGEQTVATSAQPDRSVGDDHPEQAEASGTHRMASVNSASVEAETERSSSASGLQAPLWNFFGEGRDPEGEQRSFDGFSEGQDRQRKPTVDPARDAVRDRMDELVLEPSREPELDVHPRSDREVSERPCVPAPIVDKATKTTFRVPGWGEADQAELTPVEETGSSIHVQRLDRVASHAGPIPDARPLGALGADVADILVDGVDLEGDDVLVLDPSELEEYDGRNWDGAGPSSRDGERHRAHRTAAPLPPFAGEDDGDWVNTDITDEVIADPGSGLETAQGSIASAQPLPMIELDEDLQTYIEAYKGRGLQRWVKPGILAVVLLFGLWVVFDWVGTSDTTDFGSMVEQPIPEGYGRLVFLSGIPVNVYVDGEHKGVTPLDSSVDVVAGQHLIKMVEVGSGVSSRELTLEVMKGKAQSIRYERDR